MGSKFKIIKITDWLIKWENGLYVNYEYDYPWKIDSFITKEYNYSNIDITLKTEIISYELLKEKVENLNILYSEGDFFPYYIYKLDDKSYLWVQNNSSYEPIVAFIIKNDWKEWTVIYDATNTNGKYVFEYCTKIFPNSVLNLGGIVLHGVLLEHNGKGIIISAPSGIGKTTHARMWRDKENALIINGDRALCRKVDNKWIGFGMPWCGTSGEYINRSVPICAIVVLEQSKENHVHKLEKLDAFNNMIPNIVAPTWELDLLNKGLDYLEDIIEEIPIYKLKCRPDIEAVEVLKKEIDKL